MSEKKGRLTPQEQLQVLNKKGLLFSQKIKPYFTNDEKLKPISLTTFQVNIGKKCNQACKHCHVDASPSRTEMMDLETMDTCLKIIKNNDTFETVDITGGAPEMHPYFCYFVEECVKLEKHVIDRCNLTILEEDGYEYLYDFLVKNKVEIVASLPYFEATHTDRQRGTGVFNKSITALQRLNSLGYGSEYPLNLVYNPVGTYLSGNQKNLEKEFKKQLYDRYNIIFNNLYCINNMPIQRFLEALLRGGQLESYMTTLVNAFNPATLEGLMCRNQISVGYDGSIYDCDFNQMLEMKIGSVDVFNFSNFMNHSIKIGNHCYGCTAGTGSSCGGEVIASSSD